MQSWPNSTTVSAIPMFSISSNTTLDDGNIEHYAYLSKSEMDALSVMSLISAGLSFFGAGSVMLCSVINKRVCYPEVFPTFHLSLADMLSSMFLIISSTLFLATDPTYPGSSGSCGYIMAVVTSLYTSSFFLTISYALEALFRFRRRLTDGTRLDTLNAQVVSNRWMYIFYAVCWLLPFIFAVCVIDVNHSLRDGNNNSTSGDLIIIPKQCSSCFANFRFNERYCWNQVDEGHKWHVVIRLIFLIPLILVVVINMVLYILIARLFRQVSMRRGLLSYHQRQEESLLTRKAAMYQGVFVICWFPSAILGIVSFTGDYQMNTYYWLLLIQAILGPLHGIFNCILYGWKRDSFRRVMSEGTPLLNTNRAATICCCFCSCLKEPGSSREETESFLRPGTSRQDLDDQSFPVSKSLSPHVTKSV